MISIYQFVYILTINAECKIKDCDINRHLDHMINDVLFYRDSCQLDNRRLAISGESHRLSSN